MKQIRRSIFETNSSSIHTLSFGQPEDNYSIDFNNKLPLFYFDRMWAYEYSDTSFMGKLCYVTTYMTDYMYHANCIGTDDKSDLFSPTIKDFIFVLEDYLTKNESKNDIESLIGFDDFSQLLDILHKHFKFNNSDLEFDFNAGNMIGIDGQSMIGKFTDLIKAKFNDDLEGFLFKNGYYVYLEDDNF